MSHLFPLLLEALSIGSVRLHLGRLAGHSGYLDVPTRTVVLNPDADPAQLEAELAHDLAQLIERDATGDRDDDPAAGEPAGLSLVHSTDHPEIPSPRLSLDEPTAPDLRVIG